MKDINKLPKFPGWRPVKPTEKLISSDVFVLLNQAIVRTPRALTPQAGDEVGRYAGHYASEWLDVSTLYWYPYRRATNVGISMRLAPHKAFSQPLPLP